MPENNCQNLINSQAADKLIAAHDGDLALLYLYICRTGCSDMEKAAGALCRTLREMEAAEEKLRRMGLLDGREFSEKAEVLPPPVEIPQYTAKEVARFAERDGQFAAVLSEAAKIMGHSLSGNDMKTLLGIYDYLALPTEVILMLLNYCSEVYQEKYKDSRRPSIKAIEKEAYQWERLEILSLEQAEEYIKNQKERRSGIGRIKALLGIHGRELSAAERKTFESWLDMGFEDEAISIAYDRTTANTGGFRLRYMNRILENWHSANIHTAEQVALKDSPRGNSYVPAADNSTKTIDRSILDKI